MDNIISKIKDKLNKGEEVSPFLFIGKNLEIVNQKVISLAKDLLKQYEIPNAYLYTLVDNNETIKVKEIKEFMNYTNSKPPFRFQIFFIENISRLNIASSNSLLKIFEEPGVQNIIFASNAGENNILDTIISRVQIIPISTNDIKKDNEFYLSLIKSYTSNESDELLNYFFKNKLEKTDYINFLENLIIYAKKNLILIDFLEEILEDLNGIKQNNLNAKYIIDKWLLKIK
ncbi:MAG: hypothetical protein PHI37_05030 [Candidatus Gracilibacteria bacterium]|nr:hypothetical protein [Candidatus Gracilibacteria bacterium]